jgi:hypothetical protein
MWWAKVGAALQSCHHANDQLPAFALRLPGSSLRYARTRRRAGWRADLLLADEALKRSENCQVSGEMARWRPKSAKFNGYKTNWPYEVLSYASP